MPFASSKILDHGTANPIVARLTLQVFEILDHCEIAPDTRDGIKKIYMDSLARKLLRCWEIAERYKSEFIKQMDACKGAQVHCQVVAAPCVMRLEEECHNFLYEAKNFIRDVLKAFNLLYGTGFVEASEYCWPKKGKQSLIDFAEATFGPNDAKTKYLKDLSPLVERVISFRNAVEHPDGHSGTLKIRNFQPAANGKFTEPGWWLEKDGKSAPESSIGADMYGIVGNLLTFAEEIFVWWADKNLRFRNFSRIGLVPEEQRDPSKPVKYVVSATAELLQKIDLEAKRVSKAEGSAPAKG